MSATSPVSASRFIEYAQVEPYFCLLLEAAPDATVVSRRDGKILMVNTQAERLFGYRREELLGQAIEMLMPKRHRRRHTRHRAVYFLHPAVRPMDGSVGLYGLRKDGTEFPVEISLSPVITGEETLVWSAIRDITERKQAEAQLSHLAAVVKSSDDAIISMTLDGIILSWNPGAERLFGYKNKEIMGRPISLLAPLESRTETLNILARVRHGESLEHYETTRLHKNGHRITVSMTISPVRKNGGAVVGVAAIARDITEQRRAETALRESEERFRVALKTSPTVVFNQDRDLRYTWINSPVLAWAAQDSIGHTDIEVLGREEGEHLAAIKRQMLRSGVGTHAETNVTFQGETHYYDLTVEPLHDYKGACVGLTCAATDITQLKLSVLEQKHLIARLQEALDEVNLLSGLLPICASCKRIKDKHDTWQALESYIQLHSEAKFTHGLCPDCLRKLYPEYCTRG
jgi:PAS domain S-box-containing protein